jgi:hypothetical protein
MKSYAIKYKLIKKSLESFGNEITESFLTTTTVISASNLKVANRKLKNKLKKDLGQFYKNVKVEIISINVIGYF